MAGSTMTAQELEARIAPLRHYGLMVELASMAGISYISLHRYRTGLWPIPDKVVPALDRALSQLERRVKRPRKGGIPRAV